MTRENVLHFFCGITYYHRVPIAAQAQSTALAMHNILADGAFRTIETRQEVFAR